MFVKKIEFGIPGSVPIAIVPSWSVLESHLRSLDGNNSDGVLLQSSGTSYMAVSGGIDNKLVVAGYLEGYGSFICASGPAKGPTTDVSVNGDFNQYPSKNVVDICTAVAAARVFCEGGVLAEHLEWERQ
jgi:hypothetical protein